MSDKNWLTVYFKNPANGVVTEHSMFGIDARDAVRRFPDQFKLSPWDDEKAHEKPKSAPHPKV